MEHTIQAIVAASLLIVGASHLARPKAWVELFLWLSKLGEAGAFATAAMHLPLGLLIVFGHWVWSWPEALVTLLGCAYTLKGTLYLVHPAWGLRMISRVALDRPGEMRAAGVALAGLGLVVGWIRFG